VTKNKEKCRPKSQISVANVEQNSFGEMSRGQETRRSKKWAAVGAAATFKIAYEKFFFQQRISSL